MAVVDGFKRRSHIPKLHPTHVICFWSVSVDDRGTANLLQIDTTGSDERQNPGKQSQTIQLSRESARELFELLSREFKF